MKRTTLISLFAIAVMVVFVPMAQASTLFSADFNSTSGYSDGLLMGQQGWFSSSGSGGNNQAVSNSATNGFVTMTVAGDDEAHTFTPAVAGNSGTSVFLSADITVTTAQTTGDYFMHLTDGGTSNFYARTYIKASGTGFVMALGTGTGTTGLVYGTTVLSFGTSYHVLDELDLNVGTTNDGGKLFINPVDPFGVGDTAYVNATQEGADPLQIGGVQLRQGGATSSARLTVDNILVQTVPEPATFVLAGLGFVGVCAVARKRKMLRK